MKLASYGINEVIRQTAIASAVAAGIVGASFVFAVKAVLIFLFLPALWATFVLYFFRDPRRAVPSGENNIIAPADGTIVEIAEEEEGEFVGARAKKVGIFLSLFSVHINRSPVSGKVAYLKYMPGRFFHAGSQEAARQNESNSVGLVTGKGRVLVKQIAGVIARRIVCAVKDGDSLEKGEKFGMIKFGSRTELYVPIEARVELKVSVGQKVKAGETIIGVFR